MDFFQQYPLFIGFLDFLFQLSFPFWEAPLAFHPISKFNLLKSWLFIDFQPAKHIPIPVFDSLLQLLQLSSQPETSIPSYHNPLPPTPNEVLKAIHFKPHIFKSKRGGTPPQPTTLHHNGKVVWSGSRKPALEFESTLEPLKRNGHHITYTLGGT